MTTDVQRPRRPPMMDPLAADDQFNTADLNDSINSADDD